MKFLLWLIFTSASFAQVRFDDQMQINTTLDNWHLSASKANFKSYFDVLDRSSVFIGTDATENWNKTEFEKFAKPYFDKGKAWSFTALERHIYFSDDKKIAWFDELLSTQMKICRGSGVLIKTKLGWKIKQYVLSMTIPNDLVNQVTSLKSVIEDAEIKRLQKQ